MTAHAAPVLVLTGSARRDSYTRRLGAAIAEASGGVLAPRLTELPYFDQDLEPTPPAVVEQLRRQVRDAELVVVVTPEYNGTVPGLLGNAIDWLSRPHAAGALHGKRVVAVAASPGGVGGARALVSLRTVLGNAGAELVGPGSTVADVHLRLEDGTAHDALEAEARELLRSTDAVQERAA